MAELSDQEMLRSTAEAMVAEERARKHFIVADRMQRALSTVPITPPALTASSPHLAAANGREAILEITPRLQLDDLLPDAAGTLHLFDGLSLGWRHIRIAADPDCRACGSSASS